MNNKLVRLLAISFVIKCIIALIMPLSFDESYYWVWSHHLQLSYFDHPPMVAWLYSLGHLLEPFGHIVRLPFLIISHLTIFIWARILTPYLSHKKVYFFCLLAILSPLMGFGGIIVNPDIPLMFFWSLSLWLLIKAVDTQSLKYFALLGACLGLGFLSKYHTVLFLPFALIWLASIGRLKSAKTWGLIAAGFICFFIFSSPVFIWNSANEWISFKFQLNHGLGASKWNPNWTAKYLFDQLIIFFPLVVFYAYKNNKASLPKNIETLLKIMAWGPVLFFLFTSFKGRVEANWPIIGFPAMLALAVSHSDNLRWKQITAGFWAVLTLTVVSQATLQWLPNPNNKIKTYELHYYKPVADKISQILTEKNLPVFASSFQMSSQLYYHLKKPVYKLKEVGRFDFYDMRSESTPNSNYYFVTGEKGILPDWATTANHRIINSLPLSDELFIREVSIP